MPARGKTSSGRIWVKLKDEQTGQKLLGSQGTTMQASSLPEAWGLCESVVLTSVLPYWKEGVPQRVLLTEGIGQKDFVLD